MGWSGVCKGIRPSDTLRTGSEGAGERRVIACSVYSLPDPTWKSSNMEYTFGRLS